MRKILSFIAFLTFFMGFTALKASNDNLPWPLSYGSSQITTNLPAVNVVDGIMAVAESTLRLDNNADPTTGYGLCSFDGALRFISSENAYVINLSNSAGKGISWKVEVPSAGTYSLQWRYAGGGSAAVETAQLMVNGTTALGSVYFPKPSGSTAFRTTDPLTVSLVAGVNAIRIETTEPFAFADIEWLEITGNNPLATDCNNEIGSGGGNNPPPAPTVTTIRLEESTTPSSGYCSVDGVYETKNEGADNGAYLNTDNMAGTGINWMVSVPTAGSYQLAWRFANLSGNRDGKLLINGEAAIDNISLAATGSWTSWIITPEVTVNLAAGENNIRLEATTADGLANIDWMEITGIEPEAASCGIVPPPPATYELTTVVYGEGSVSPAAGSFDSGEIITLTATPASGWQFVAWSGDANGTTNPLNLTMDASKAVTAIFSDGTLPKPDNSMIGFASVGGEGYTTTTGGQGGAIINISTLAELQAWATSRENKTVPEIVHISGKIESPSTTVVTIKHGANVSVFGVGTTAELKNIGLNFRNYKNVIVRNLKIHEVFYPNDGLTIDQCQHVWIDHNEFYSIIGPGIGVDTYDGLMDIKNGSRYVTVSWNHFHDHMKTVLIGHTDNSSAEVTDREIRVTFHHNFFENTDGRNPSLRWGAVHMFNNYFKDISDYGIAVRQGAHALLENNVYENVKLPISTNKFTGEGYACESGNLFTGTSGNNSITQAGCDWWNSSTLPYTYSLDAVATITTTVPAHAGVGKVDITGGAGPVVTSYQLTTTVNGQGNVSPAEGTFDAGTTATLTATAASGWKFDNWSGDVSGTVNPLGVSMNADKAITANFSQIDDGGENPPVSGMNNSLVGYATLTTGTTGGQGGRKITVTTGTELQAALTAKIKESEPLIIYVAGKITTENSPGLTKIDVKEVRDVSILGVGTSGELDGIGIKVWKSGNIILRNLKIHHVLIGDKDCISIEGPSDHIWVDHCELYNQYQGVHKDYYDALLDAKSNSEYITFSWNYLHDSWKASLAGSSESDSYDRKITYHHNYFENLNSRLPLFRGGNGHVFNNYYKDVESTAINSRIGACLKIENNYFENVINPYVSAYSSVVGYGDISGNVLVNSPFKYASDTYELGACTSNIPYAYSHVLDEAADVPSKVLQYVGVGKINVFEDDGGETPPPATSYQLTTSVIGQGTVNPANELFLEGAVANITATPASGWKFESWSGDASGTGLSTTVTMDGHKTVTAIFSEVEGGGTPAGPTVRIDNTATPETGLCSFDGSLRVTNSGVPVINLSNTAGKGISWKIEVPEAGNYSLVWNYAGGGSAAVETAQLMINGVIVNPAVVFTKPKDSQTFLSTAPLTVGLSAGVNEIRIETTVNEAFADIAWIEVTGNQPIAADCSREIGSGGNGGDPEPTMHVLSGSVVGEGTIDPETGNFEEGTTVMLTATAAQGWQFGSWSGDASGSSATLSLLMDGNKEVVANFTRITHQLSTTINGAGSVSPSEGTFNEGTEVTLTATPEAGWKFDGWGGNASGTSLSVNLNMDNDKAVVANFSRIEFTLTVVVVGSGSVSYDNRIYYVGEEAALTALAASGHQFDGWSGDASGTNNPLLIQMDGHKTVTANFSKTGNKGGNSGSGGVVLVYPNPMTTFTTFEVSLIKKAKLKISILNSQGNLVQIVTNQSYNAGIHKVLYVNEAIKPGLYFYVVEIDKEVIRERLLVE